MTKFGKLLYAVQHAVINATCLMFRWLGKTVGTWPKTAIGFTVVLTIVCAFGACNFRINQDMHTGYLSRDAAAHREFAIAEEFHRHAGRPYYFGIFATALDNGSVLRQPQFNEIQQIHEHVFRDIEIVDHNTTYTFDKICGLYCFTMEPVWRFKDFYDKRLEIVSKSTPNSKLPGFNDDVVLSYPITTVSGFKLNMAPYFYGVSMETSKKNRSNSSVSNISNVKIVALWFNSDQRRNATMERVLNRWELKVFEDVKGYRSDLVDIVPYGNYVISSEVLRAGSQVVPFYSLGFVLMLSFIGVSVATSELHYGQLGCGFTLITLAAVVSPVLASAATFGVIGLLDLHINVMMMITPFLILAIGVDDAFLLIHSWQRLAVQGHRTALSKADRLGLVLFETGPSIFVTSLTNSLAFSIGAIASPPEISMFCVAVAVGMAAAFIYQVTLFSPVMLLCSKDPSNSAATATSTSKPSSIKSHCLSFSNSFVTVYSQFLVSLTGRLLGVLLLFCYLFTAISGVLALKTELDPEQLMPKGSILLKTLELRREHLWREYHPIEVIVNRELNYSKSQDYELLMSFVDRLESLPRSMRSELTDLWLRDYEAFLKTNSKIGEVFDFLDLEEEAGEKRNGENTVDLSDLPDFLANPLTAHYNNKINWHKNGSTVHVTSFSFRVAFRDISSLGLRARAVTEWRQLIASYHSTLNASLWDPDAPFSDIILNVQGITTKTLVMTLISMSFVCVLFIPNLCALLCAVAAIASICVGVIGFLSWWGANLDPVTMADMIMAVGFSVDYTAHISYHFYKSGELTTLDSFGRLEQTFSAVLWPMIQAGLSTVICMIPQTFSPMSAHLLFVKTVVLVVTLGLAHGLFFVPIVLTCLPNRWTGGRTDKKMKSVVTESRTRDDDRAVVKVLADDTDFGDLDDADKI